MKQFILKNKNSIIGLVAVLLIGGITMAFQDSPMYHYPNSPDQVFVDSPPPAQELNRELNQRDYEQLVETVKKAIALAAAEIKKIDFQKIQNQLNENLKQVDFDKIRQKVDEALKSVNVDKIMEDVRSSLDKTDMKKLNEEIKQAMDESKKDMEKARLEINNIDFKELRKEIEKLKLEFNDTDMKKLKEDFEKAKKEFKMKTKKSVEI